ncbi:MAG: hypothetical protein RL499_1353 [Actinomycetota bacterium]|jgi:hypothetical protein
MSGAWNQIDPGEPRPSLPDLIASWREFEWEARPFRHDAMDRFLGELSRINTLGGYQFGRWRARRFPAEASWFVSRNMTTYYELFRVLFDDPLIRSDLAALQIPTDLSNFRGTLHEERHGALMLDGMWAGLLIDGGAYAKFEGSHRDAKGLAGEAVESLIEGRYEDFRLDTSDSAWTPWFRDVAWDRTFVLTDRANAEITVLCVTDMD